MSRRKIRFTVSTLIFLAFLGIQLYKQYHPTKNVLSTSTTNPQQVSNFYKVTKVIDGDTLSVLIANKSVKVRVLGINTPETVDPRKPVQCFGHEASDHAKTILTGQQVSLETDPTQDDKDKYGRLLRYIVLPNSIDYGLTMIKDGYAYEYTYDIPYRYQTEYKNAQKEAESKKIGLWSDSSCNGKL